MRDVLGLITSPLALSAKGLGSDGKVRMPLWQALDVLAYNTLTFEGRVLSGPESGEGLTIRLITSMQNENEDGWIPLASGGVPGSADIDSTTTDFYLGADGVLVPFYRYIRWEVIKTTGVDEGDATVTLMGLGDHR